MKISNSKIHGRRRELPLAALAKTLTLTAEEKKQLKDFTKSITITGVIDKEIAKPAGGIEVIYIIEVVLKDADIPTEFLKAFDRQTEAQTIFEIPWDRGALYMMANKRIKDRVSLGNHYATDVMHEIDLEDCLDKTLEDTYSNLYSIVVGLQKRKDETADGIEERSKRIKALEKEIEKLERAKNGETQLNKKVAINDKIRNLLEQIKGEE